MLPAEDFGKDAYAKYIEETSHELFRIRTKCLEPRKKNYRVVESTPGLNKNIDIAVRHWQGTKKFI